MILLEYLGRLSETSHPFFQSFSRVDKFGRMGASVEAKVLLPLKSLAYGVAPHCFADYFQVSKPSMARECVKHFIRVIPDFGRDIAAPVVRNREFVGLTRDVEE